jgi:hypothetical protein
MNTFFILFLFIFTSIFLIQYTGTLINPIPVTQENMSEITSDIQELQDDVATSNVVAPTSVPVPKKAIITLVRKPVDFPLWMKYHRDMGIGHFYIRIEDSPGWEEYFKSQPDITYEVGESDKNNNYETLQTRQISYVGKCLKQAQQHNVSWAFFIDADEMLEGDLSFLDTLSPAKNTLKIHNVEAIYDGTENTCFDAKTFVKCHEKGSCRSYVNGKAGGRIENGITIAGPHDFMYNSKTNGPHLYKVPFELLHILHFDSCSFGSWVEKFHHLSKNAIPDKIPFPYYKESIELAKSTYDAYNKLTMNVHNQDKDNLYIRK